jgi:hypothetical protein
MVGVDTMSRNSTLLILSIGIVLFSVVGCQPKKKAQDSSKISETIKQFDMLMPGNIDGDSSQNDIQAVLDMLANEDLPGLSSNDKDELNEIIKYLDSTKEKLPDCLEDDDNKIEYLTTLMNLNLFFARINPNNFDVNLKVTTTYILIAASVTSDFNSEKINRFRDEFNEKGIRSAKALVKKFPDNPMAYGQLAHTTLVTGGDEKEVVRLLNKCLEVDRKTEYCKEFLDSIDNSKMLED